MSKKIDKKIENMRIEEKSVNAKLDLRKTIMDKPYIITGILGVINNKLNNIDLREITVDYQGLLVNPSFLSVQSNNPNLIKIISFMRDEKADEELSLNIESTFDRTIVEALSKISILNKAMKRGTSEDIREIKEEVIGIVSDLNDYMNEYLLTAQSDLQYSKKLIAVAELEEEIKTLKSEKNIAKRKKEDTTDLEININNKKEELKEYGVSFADKLERKFEDIAKKVL